LGRIGLYCVSNSNRLYATVDAGKFGGIYRSDDAGLKVGLTQIPMNFGEEEAILQK
jgi:hypothetical protein